MYATTLVPKYTKYFQNEADAQSYKDEISNLVWMTRVAISLDTVYGIQDGDKTVIFTGEFVTLS